MTARPTTRRLATATLAAALVPAGVLGLASTADATTRAGSTITVTASDSSVSSGEQFVLSGKLSGVGVVRVQSREGSTWKSLPGAVVDTRRDGTYRVRVQLDRTGKRTLRVFGDPSAAGADNAAASISIRVS